jgi:rhodanese-related sulfurtransferase
MINEVLQFLMEHWMLSSVWLISGVLLLRQWTRGGIPAVSPQQLAMLVNRQNAQIVDIRDAGAFKAGHIVGAVNIPATLLAEKIKAGTLDKARPVIVVCQAGIQAGPAANVLKTAGFDQAYKLQGGMQGWLADNMPVVQD